MVCVSDWYELLFEQYCNDNQYAVKQYQKPGINNSNQSFMRRCFDDMDFADTKKGRECTKLIEEKRAQNTKYPTDSKPLQGNVYDQKQDIRATLSTKSGKGPTPRANGETIKYTEDDKLRMASTTYARSTLAKNLPVKEQTKAPSTFNSFFTSCPKPFLKSFREHENFARRAIQGDAKLKRKYDLYPSTSLVTNAFTNCINQKNKGLIEDLFIG